MQSGEVNLEKYRCAKCGRIPEKANDLFTGCACGHRLFRLQTSPRTAPRHSKSAKQSNIQEDMGFLTIKEKQIGIYQINVNKLMEHDEKEEESPVVVGNNGIYSIRLEKLNRKTPIRR